MEALNIRAIYGGAHGQGSLGEVGVGDLSELTKTAGAMKGAGEKGGSLLDMISGAMTAAALGRGAFKKVASWAGKGVNAVKNFAKKTPKGLQAADDIAAGADDAMRATGKGAKAIGKAVKGVELADDAVKATGFLAKAGRAISTGAKALGKVAVPVTVITSSAEVLAGGRAVEEGSFTDRLSQSFDGVSDNLEKKGALGIAASTAINSVRDSTVVGASVVEETVSSMSQAVKTITSSEASIWDKIGAGLDVVGAAQIRGFEMGAAHVVGGKIDDYFQAKNDRDNAEHQRKLETMIADRVSRMSPEGRARYEAARSRMPAATAPSQQPAQDKSNDNSLPFGLEVATAIPSGTRRIDRNPALERAAVRSL
jgi:hypothetical protein